MPHRDHRHRAYPWLLALLALLILNQELPRVACAAQPLGDLPPSLDWRDHSGNYCPPVHDRSDCDSSWAFAAIAELEARYALAIRSPGQFIDLSEQTIVSCDAGSLGCGGGFGISAAQFLQTQGAPPERCFPYVAGSSDCANACPNWSARAVRIASYQPISPTVEALKAELQDGPFQVGFEFYEDIQTYAGGVYEYAAGRRLAEQSALLVGYADDLGRYGGGYFIAQYSAGASWGEQGFFRIGYSQVTGIVGFGKNAYAYEVFIPVVDSYEDDDAREAARPIAAGAPQGRNLQPAFDEDWSTFTLTAKADVTLATSGPANGSTQMWLYDSGGSVLAHSDNADGSYARIIAPLGPGAYYARVTPYYADETLSNYTLSLAVDTWPHEPPTLWLRGYGTNAGGWSSQDRFPRTLGDVNGDGRADVVGFGNAGTYVALSTGSKLAAQALWVGQYGANAGGWSSQDVHPRTVGDVNGDGKADVIGFGNSGVYVSLSTGSRFSAQTLWIARYGFKAGGWTSQNTYPRLVADVNGDGKDDVVGFGNAGVYVSLSTGSNFGEQTLWLRSFSPTVGGWTSQDLYPRALGDINGDGKADIVGFGNKGVYTSLSTGRSFTAPTMGLRNYGASAGGWTSQNVNPRTLAGTSADAKADIIGYDEEGAMLSLSRGASFAAPVLRKRYFGVNAGGWTTQDTYPRSIADMNGDGKADLVGFGSAGVYVAIMP